MYAASWLSPLMQAPLDTSGLLRCIAPEWSALIAANATSKYAAVLLKNYEVWCHCVPSDSGKSDVLYDAQAGYQANVYAHSWVAHGTTPPPIASLTQEALRISVNESGFTVIDPTAQVVWSSVAFTNGLIPATHSICGSIIGSIIAAG